MCGPSSIAVHSDRTLRPIFRMTLPEQALRLTCSLSLALAIVVSVLGCGSVHLDRDPDIAPAANVDRIWIPPQSVSVANVAAPQLEELRNVGESSGLQGHNAAAYDLPALVELALRINPQTRSAWYAAQAAEAQLGQAHATDYPKIAAEGVGGYLKLPIQFPGQTLVIRNEAFLPQIKVSLRPARLRPLPRRATRRARAAYRREFRFQPRDPGCCLQRRKGLLRPLRREGERAARRRPISNWRRPVSAPSRSAIRWVLRPQPQILLAKQVEAQAIYDLENARSMVHDAESGLAKRLVSPRT